MRAIKSILFLFFSIHSYGQTKFQKDFDYYWNVINDDFAYFDTQKTNWKEVRKICQPFADTITNVESFIQLLETVNNELYNGHISLNINLLSSNRLIPSGADFWVSYQDKSFIIQAVRKDFNAALCGLKKGMIITKYNNVPIDIAVQKFLPRSVSLHDKRMYEYAANMLLAGTHNIKRIITAKWNSIEQIYFPDTIPNKTATGYREIIESKIVAPGIGYIKINNSLGNSELIKAFDKALDSLWNTKGLIIDLSETPGGGNTTVARAIMSRFIVKEMPYQKHSLPAEEKQYGVKRSWIEFVSSRGSIYKKPLIILVSRWTGSMGEGLAIGFDGMKRATVMGDKMAGLIGAIYSYSLPETKIGFSFPVEKLYHINGLPRENFVPAFPEADSEKSLAKAIKLLTNQKK